MLVLEVVVKPLGNLTEQVLACVSSVDAVVAVGVDVLLEVLVCLDECLGILEGVLWMHIVVGQSMTEQQCSRQVVDA